MPPSPDPPILAARRRGQRPTILLLVASVLALAGSLVLGTQNAPAQDITASCDPTCSAWRTADFNIAWTEFPPQGVPGTRILSGCVDGPLTSETKGTLVWCAVELLDATQMVIGTAEESRLIRLDKTRPLVTGASGSRPPDANGWYRAPVRVAFSGSDATSGIQSCTAPTYAAPDSRTASVAGTCTDIAGNRSTPFTFRLRYDATGPDVTSGKPARKPDHGRWYRRAVTWRFHGKDALSGLAECPPALYEGPDGRAARVTGACRDRAGNVTGRSFRLYYDATAPARPTLNAVSRDRAVRLQIGTTSDVRSIAIRRAPGRGATRDSTIYRGRPKSFTDVHARNGTRYRYTVVARDRAANRSRRTVTAVPGPRLLEPPDGAVLYAAPLLRWTPVRGADYFNVQLRRDGRKVLSRWPTQARLQLLQSWRFQGRVRRLATGHYTWDVWAGFGPRSAAQYGPRIGRRHFVVPEPSG